MQRTQCNGDILTNRLPATYVPSTIYLNVLLPFAAEPRSENEILARGKEAPPRSCRSPLLIKRERKGKRHENYSNLPCVLRNADEKPTKAKCPSGDVWVLKVKATTLGKYFISLRPTVLFAAMILLYSIQSCFYCSLHNRRVLVYLDFVVFIIEEVNKFATAEQKVQVQMEADAHFSILEVVAFLNWLGLCTLRKA